MLVYPQLSTGALSPYPIVKRRATRTVVNRAADGSRVVYADPAGAAIEWELHYNDLSDAELQALLDFHAAAEGSLQGFTFLDPTANLLSWSEDLGNAAWSAAPLLTVTAQDGAWRLTNTGAGPQSLTQTLDAPPVYRYCFSVSLRSTQAVTATLIGGTDRAAHAVLPAWNRFSLSCSGDPEASSIAFGIELPAGAAVDVLHPQAEAQGTASLYKRATTGGVYENARFRDDTLLFTTTGVGRHSATVTIYYANHL